MFLITFVDVLGFTIVIPLLAFYAEKFGASRLVATLIVSCYAVCSLISTPIIGRLSDQYGRKRLLLISQAGTFVGFLVLGNATALWMVFLGRIIDGCTAGNLSIAQAYISDHTEPKDRAKAFGVIGIAFGIGFMAGPAIGGRLGEYGLHVPFLVAASMSLLSIVCTAFLLPNDGPALATAPVAQEAGPAGRRPSAFDWRVYAEYFGRPALRSLYVQFFLFSFAFSCFMSGYALWSEANPHFHWGPKQVGYLFMYSGFLGILIQGGLLGRLVKKFGELKMTIVGFVFATIAYVLVGFATSVAGLLVAATVNSFGHGVLRPVITARMSQTVGRHEQGTVLGISGSLSSVAMAMAPPTGGFMLQHLWLLAWALIPAAVSALGLMVTVATANKVEAAKVVPPGASAGASAGASPAATA